MPSTSVLFNPELDERQLDSEADKVDERLQEVGENVGATIDADINAPDDLGGGVGGGAGGGGGGGPGAAELAEGVGALGGKIPAPVAGVAAAAALPIAIAGGVGTAMLGAMTDASARLQTDNKLLGIAVDNFFREPGNILSENVTRPLAENLLDQSVKFDEELREGDTTGAFERLIGNTGEENTTGTRAGGLLGGIGGALGGAFAGAKAGGALGATVGSIIPGAGTAAGGAVGAVGGAIVGAIGGSQIGNRVGKAIAKKIPEFPDWKDDIIDLFPGWLQNSPGIIPTFPDWRSFIPQFSWPSLPQPPQWPSLPDPPEFPPFPGWPDIPQPEVDFDLGASVDISGSVQDLIDGRINVDSVVDEAQSRLNLPGGGGDAEPTGPGGGVGDLLPSMQSGGRVTRSGVAEVHRGELVSDPDRLVSELADAITGGASRPTAGGDGPMVDTSDVENKLDRLHRDMQQLRRALDVSVEVDGETIARAAANGQRDRVNDTDPLA